MDFDYEKGGEMFGGYYPPLKPPLTAIKGFTLPVKSVFYIYEPGNGTHYEVLFTTYNNVYGRETVMTLVNFRKSMVLPGPVEMHSLDYMQEKLQINEGDCYALIPLINQFFKENP